MKTKHDVASALALLCLLGTVPSFAYTLREKPTASGNPPALDGGFAALHFRREAMPIRYRINPASPTAEYPLIVPARRDPPAEFVRTVRRAFERLEGPGETTLRFRYDLIPDVFDGENVVGWGDSSICAPGVAAYNRSLYLQYRVQVPNGSDAPVNVSAFIGDPIQYELDNGVVYDVREPGETVESDTVICWNFFVSFSTDFTPGTVDLEGVVEHELGHLAGLMHADFPASTMHNAVELAQPVPELGDGYARTVTTDDTAGLVHLYGKDRGKHAHRALEGRVTVGSLFGALPPSPPLTGFPVTPGSPAYGVRVIATNADGVVEASVVTRQDGAFSIQGLSGPEPYSLLVASVPYAAGVSRFLDREYAPILYHAPKDLRQVRLGRPVEVVVDDALPEGPDLDGLGVAGLRPPAPSYQFLSRIADDPATEGFVEAVPEYGAFVVRRGEAVGSDHATPNTIYDGSIYIGASAEDPDAAPVAIDFGAGVRVKDFLYQVSPDETGKITYLDAFVRIEVDKRARPGLRNLVLTDRAGRRMLVPGKIEVR